MSPFLYGNGDLPSESPRGDPESAGDNALERVMRAAIRRGEGAAGSVSEANHPAVERLGRREVDPLSASARAKDALHDFFMPDQRFHPSREAAASILVTLRHALAPSDEEHLKNQLNSDSDLNSIYDRHGRSRHGEAAGQAEVDANIATYLNRLTDFLAQDLRAVTPAVPATMNRRRYVVNDDLFEHLAGPARDARPPALAREEAFRFPSENLPAPLASTRPSTRPSRQLDDRQRDRGRGDL